MNAAYMNESVASAVRGWDRLDDGSWEPTGTPGFTADDDGGHWITDTLPQAEGDNTSDTAF